MRNLAGPVPIKDPGQSPEQPRGVMEQNFLEPDLLNEHLLDLEPRSQLSPEQQLLEQVPMELGTFVEDDLLGQLPLMESENSLENLEEITDEDWNALSTIFTRSRGWEQILNDVQIGIQSQYDLTPSSLARSEVCGFSEDKDSARTLAVDVSEDRISLNDANNLKAGTNMSWEGPQDSHLNNSQSYRGSAAYLSVDGQGLDKTVIWQERRGFDINEDSSSINKTNRKSNQSFKKGNRTRNSLNRKQYKNKELSYPTAETWAKVTSKLFQPKPAQSDNFLSSRSKSKLTISSSRSKKSYAGKVSYNTSKLHNKPESRLSNFNNELNVITFSFAEEYPEFREKGPSTYKIRSCNPPLSSMVSGTPRSKTNLKQAFVFRIPRGPSELHEWTSQQRKLIDENQDKNALRNFFELHLTTRNGSKVTCERNNKFYLERQQSHHYEDSKTNISNNSPPHQQLLISSSKTTGKKPAVAKKSCSKGSARLIQRSEKNVSSMCTNGFDPREKDVIKQSIKNGWNIYWKGTGKVGGVHSLETNKIAISDSDLMNFLTDTETDASEGGSELFKSEIHPIITLSDDDDVMILDTQ